VEHPCFAILIATRNRAAEISILLSSISSSNLLPSEIIVVSSGVPVNDKISQYPHLPIKLHHIEGRGQIRQKQIGLSLISDKVKWILFLDDDLRILPTTLSELFASLTLLGKENLVLGLGLSGNTPIKYSKLSRALKIVKRNQLGKVGRSGNNFNYQDSQEIIKTSWLNGASMWHRDAVGEYNFDYLDSKYSICEDLIFSYKVSKLGNLFYIPTAKFEFQSEVKPLVDEFESFKANCYWRYFFVISNKELSKNTFLFRQFLRTVKFIFAANSIEDLFSRLIFASKIYFDCVGYSDYESDPYQILKSRNV